MVCKPLHNRQGYTLLETLVALAVATLLMTGMAMILPLLLGSHTRLLRQNQGKILADGLEEALRNELVFAREIQVTEDGSGISYLGSFGRGEIRGEGPAPQVPGFSYDSKTYQEQTATLSFAWEEPVCTVTITVLGTDGTRLLKVERPIRVHAIPSP